MLDEIKTKKRTGFRKLTSIAQLRGGSDLDFDHDEHDEDEPTGVAVDLIPDAMIEDRMASVAGYRERNGYCLVIEAPSADMVGPLCHSLQQAADWTGWISRSAPLKSKEDNQVERLVRSLSNGGRIFAISQDPTRLLPPDLLSLADDIVKIPAPGRTVLSKVIKAVTGELPIDLADDVAAGMSFNQIAGCIRESSSAAECAERLRRAANSVRRGGDDVSDAPLLHDLHGYGQAAEWAKDLVEDVAAWRRGEIPWSSLSSRSVLHGAAGVGKTQYARSVARTAGLTFFASSVSAWFANSAGYLDSVIKQFDELLARAQAHAPSLILLDELEGIPRRSDLDRRGRDWWLPVVNHILSALDGAVAGRTDGVVIVGTTNNPERLDEALLRPGRMHPLLEVPLPDQEALEGILRQHLNGDLAAVDLRGLAGIAVGSTGADVVGWVKSARRSARAAGRPMQVDDLATAIAPSDKRSSADVWRTCLHEAAHAVVADKVGLGPVLDVSIIARSGSGGFTRLGHDGKASTPDEIERVALQALAGRAAEEVFLGDPGVGSGGSSFSDLAVATRAIGMLHASTGARGSLLYRGGAEDISHLLAINPSLAKAVEDDLARTYERAMAVVETHRVLIEHVAKYLMAERHIGCARFKLLLVSSDTSVDPNDTSVDKVAANG